ncbi:MAG: hypothetical protein CMP24_06835 [Rickettsiales bacterium]|nr:hypothetical protein [Rickettsiales bacterium]
MLVLLFVSFEKVSAKDYILEQQGKRTLVKEHIYSETDNLKIFKLEGTFKDNAGNFGEANSIVNVITINNIVEKLEASNELIYNENIKAYNTAKRANNELKQGVGKWYFTYASKSINAIINSECLYSIRYYNDNFLTLAKCDISEKAFEQIKKIKK